VTPRENPVHVSVLVPVLNEEHYLRASVEAMLAQHLSGSFEILIIDGGSRDNTRSVVKELAQGDHRLRLLDNPGRKAARALNIGLREARGGYIARMDAHTLYPPDYLARGAERLSRGDVDHVSGPQLPQGTGRWSRRVALALGSIAGTGGATFRRTSRERPVDSGFTGMWRQETLVALGGWDEDASPNEDGELAARIRKAGGRLVCLPEMAATYVPRDSLGALARQYWRYGQYRVRTSCLHPESMRPSHLLNPTLALVLTATLLPTPFARWSRTALAFYVAAIAAESARLGWKRDASPGDAMALPLVFATMHLAWGFGFLVGCVRFGPPVAASAQAARSAFARVRVRTPPMSPDAHVTRRR
jgi:succinoglycan biosynthesis protein ExoA